MHQHFLYGKKFINYEVIESDIECFFKSKAEKIYAREANNLSNRWGYITDKGRKRNLDYIYRLIPKTQLFLFYLQSWKREKWEKIVPQDFPN